MIIVDIEASGVSPIKDSLVSVGAVDFENPSRQFYEECRIWDGAHIEEEALKVNGFSREQITDPKKKTDREVAEDFLRWLNLSNERTLAGQNVSFDRDFLQYTAYRYHLDWPLAHRVIDLHSVCYLHMIERAITPPIDPAHRHSALNLDRVLEYVGVTSKRKAHNALEDAKLETECFSRLFSGKMMFDEYKKFPVPWPKN
jgi:DNA polymerase III epsilon subunit-like protein